MLCKKCKTAIDDDAKVCKYCGAKVSNARRNMKIALFCFAVIVAASAFYLTTRPTDNADETAPPPPTEAAVTPAPAPTEASAATTAPASSEAAETDAPQDTQPTDGTTAAEVTEDDYWSLIDDTLEAANQYYEDYDAQVTFLSNRGYMYDFGSKEYVKVSDLIELGLLPESFQEKQILLLYLNADTVEQVTGVAPKGDLNMEIYCAYETDEGFALSSQTTSIGVLSRNEYKELLELYSFEHGTVLRPYANDADYAKIIAAISSYEFDTEGYIVRYIANDEKYAVAAVSKVGDNKKIYEYVLRRDEDAWSIQIANFEDMERYRKEINERCIDLNIVLLPVFDLKDFIGEEREDEANLRTALLDNGMIEENARSVFSDSSYGFAYEEYDTGQAFVFKVNPQTGYDIYPCADWKEAENIIMGAAGKKPTFIINQK